MKFVIAIVVIVLLLVIVAVSVSKPETIALEDQNMDIVRLAMYAFREGDWSSFADLHSPGYLQHAPGFENPITWSEYELAARIVHERIPDLQIRIVDIFAFKDKVAVRSIWEYRNDSYQFKCHYPDGVAHGSEIGISLIKDGKIIEEWCEHDPALIKRFCRVYKYLDHNK